MAETTEAVRLERDYSAPPERVFAAWTDVATLGRWFGCEPDQVWTIHEWEPRAGGAIHVSFDCDGQTYEVRGQFVAVDAPHTITYRWQNDELVDVRIEPHGTGSRLQLTHTYVPSDEPEGLRTEGWTASLDNLARV